jgi:basic membrane lipoprotein Med (substrate-binding protein (PBP1-ABC) superfamily)
LKDSDGELVKAKMILIVAAVVLSECPLAFAKGKSRARAYSFFDDGGKHTQAACDPESKAPSRLKRKKEFTVSKEYKGSEEIEFDAHAEAATAAWKHYFTSQSVCNAVLSKQPKP